MGLQKRLLVDDWFAHEEEELLEALDRKQDPVEGLAEAVRIDAQPRLVFQGVLDRDAPR